MVCVHSDHQSSHELYQDLLFNFHQSNTSTSNSETFEIEQEDPLIPKQISTDVSSEKNCSKLNRIVYLFVLSFSEFFQLYFGESNLGPLPPPFPTPPETNWPLSAVSILYRLFQMTRCERTRDSHKNGTNTITHNAGEVAGSPLLFLLCFQNCWTRSWGFALEPSRRVTVTL